MAAKNNRWKHLGTLFNSPDNVRVTEIISHENCDEYLVEYDPPIHRIGPHCGAYECVLKDSGYTQTLCHTVSHGRGTLVTFRKTRLRCKNCQSSFFQNPEWIHPFLHLTTPLYFRLADCLMQPLSFRSIADMQCASSAVVKAVLNTISFDLPTHLLETLCIDEFKGSSGEWHPQKNRWNVNRYHCNIVNGDGDKGYVLDILPQIKCDYVKAYFRQFPLHEHQHVKYFCCDMHNGFISVAREIFPQAQICIDMFHIVNRLNDAVTEVRSRLQREAIAHDDQDAWKLLRSSMRTMLLNETSLKNSLTVSHPGHLEKIELLSNRFPELMEAYYAVQDLHILRNEPTPVHKRAALIDWINKYSVSSIPEVAQLAKCICHWRFEIYNTWQYGKSNSPAEGLNNNIKLLMRVSYGLHDFETFRKRVLLCFGPVKIVRKTVSISREKASGGTRVKL